MCSRTPSFDSSLVLKDPGSSSTSPSRFPRMLVEYHPANPSMRALTRRKNCFHQRLPGLEVLAAQGDFMFERKLLNRRDIHGQVGSAVCEGHAAGHRSPGVEHRGRDGGMIRLHGFDKFFRRGMHFFRADEHLGRTAPAGHQSRNALRRAKLLDIFLDLKRQVVLVFALLNMTAVELFYVFAVESRLHWSNSR